MKPKVFLYGYYSVSNLGDDLLESIVVRLVQEVLPEAAISFRRSVTAHLPARTPHIIQRSVSRLLILISLARSVFLASRSQVVIFGGGGLFPPSLSRAVRIEQLLISFVARTKRASVAGLGLELSTEALLSTTRKASFQRKVLSTFQFLWLRDDNSFVLAEYLGLRGLTVNGADLAWLLETTGFQDETIKRSPPGCVRIGLSVTPVSFGEPLPNSTYLEALEGLISYFGPNAQWVGISAQEYQNGSVGVSDAQAIGSVALEVGLELDEVRILSISPSNPLTENLEALRDLDFVVAGRFHVAVLSLLVGVPVVPVAPSRKLKSLGNKVNLTQVDNTTDFSLLTLREFQIDKSACRREALQAKLAAEEFKLWLRKVST